MKSLLVSLLFVTGINLAGSDGNMIPWPNLVGVGMAVLSMLIMDDGGEIE